MLSYCLRCRKNTENINPRVSKTINGKTMILSKYAICLYVFIMSRTSLRVNPHSTVA